MEVFWVEIEGLTDVSNWHEECICDIQRQIDNSEMNWHEKELRQMSYKEAIERSKWKLIDIMIDE